MNSLRVLIACEFSGIVRNAFLARDHDAWSCDLLPAEDGSNRHIRGDVRAVLSERWDLLIVAHPPCTRLCNSGVRWLHRPPPGRTIEEMWDELRAGAELFSTLWTAPIVHKVLENPVMHRHAKALIRGYRPPAQIVQPHQFGDPFFKATGLYMDRLRPLLPTHRMALPPKGSAEHKAWSRVHRMPPGPDRGKERSRFFPGIATAMADQLPAQILGRPVRQAA